MKKGFTTIELLVVLAISGIFILIIFLTFFGVKLEFEDPPCENYRDTVAQNVPARCIQYFQGGEGR